MKEDPDFFFFFFCIFLFCGNTTGNREDDFWVVERLDVCRYQQTHKKKIWQAHLKLFSLNDYIENIEHWKQRHHHREHEML